MLKIFGIISLVALAVMMSGCLESDSPTFRIDGDDDVMTGVFAKFTIVDQSNNNGMVSYKICWDDGTCKDVKEVPVNSTMNLRHSWFVSGNYTMTATATYDDNSTVTVVKMITVRD